MDYELFDTYIGLRVAEVNATITGTDNDFLKANIDINQSLLSSNQKDKSWMLKFDSYEEHEAEAEVYDFEASIELSFLMTQSDTVKYKNVMNTYIRALVRKIRATRSYESGGWAVHIDKVGMSDGNNFDEGTFQPKITLK